MDEARTNGGKGRMYAATRSKSTCANTDLEPARPSDFNYVTAFAHSPFGAVERAALSVHAVSR